MALIKCTDCGKSISSDASACPNCGCPMDKILASMDELKKNEQAKEVERQQMKDEKAKARQERMESFTPAKKRKIGIIIAVVLVVAVAGGGLYWYFGIKKPRDEAYQKYSSMVSVYNDAVNAYNITIKVYNESADKVITANNDLDEHIKAAQSVVDSGDEPYKKKTKDKLSKALKKAQSAEVDAPEIYDEMQGMTENSDLQSSSVETIETETDSVNSKMGDVAKKTDDIKAITLSAPDYSSQISDIDKAREELEDSYLIQKQITNPKEKFVLKRISRVKPFVNFAPVTEKNDPNGHLGKKGGYTSTIYISCKWLSTRSLSGKKLIDEGTEAGGAVETYRNAEDAKRRDNYLGAFDGTAFSSGYHTVLGSMVLRVSDDLPISKQKKLAKMMTKELTKLEK